MRREEFKVGIKISLKPVINMDNYIMSVDTIYTVVGFSPVNNNPIIAWTAPFKDGQNEYIIVPSTFTNYEVFKEKKIGWIAMIGNGPVVSEYWWYTEDAARKNNPTAKHIIKIEWEE